MASHNPDPTSRILWDLSNRDPQDSSTRAANQAPLHAGSRREDPPPRDTQGSAPFVVRVGLEAARSYRSEERGGGTSRFCRNCTGDLYAVGNDPDRCTCDDLDSDPHSPVDLHT
jgi:hypothetical protein